MNRLLTITIFLSILLPFTISAEETITIFADQNTGPTKLKHGYLHGFTGNPPKEFIELAAKLKPQVWRLQDDATYKIARQLGASNIIVSLFGIMERISGKNYRDLTPWEDWNGHEARIKSIVTKIIQTRQSDYQSIFWDVWGEPDFMGADGSWKGTPEQLLELYKRTYRAVRSLNPNARLIGPDFSVYNEKAFVTFLDYLQRNNLQFEGISWHEFDNPENIVEHTATIRRAIAERPALKDMQILIDEYSGPNEHLIPGWAVGWFYYLEKATVNVAVRGCWDVVSKRETWSDCWAGLNGLLSKDNKSPHPLYWVHKEYADMDGKRLVTKSSYPRSVAIANLDDSKKEIKLLAGRYINRDGGKTKGPEKQVIFSLEKYPYGSSSVEIEIKRIPNENINLPLVSGPIFTSRKSVPVKNGVIYGSIPSFQDGDAYIIIIKPKF